jgi:hypothetical protein
MIVEHLTTRAASSPKLGSGAGALGLMKALDARHQ